MITDNSLNVSNWSTNKQLYAQEVQTANNNNDVLENPNDSGCRTTMIELDQLVSVQSQVLLRITCIKYAHKMSFMGYLNP